MLIKYSGCVNGQHFSEVEIKDSSVRTYGQDKQPPSSVIESVFTEDILPTLEKYRLATTFDHKYGEEVMHAVSCTSGKTGFSTDYRDTIMKVVRERLIVFHHNIRTKNQYHNLMGNLYPNGITNTSLNIAGISERAIGFAGSCDRFQPE